MRPDRPIKSVFLAIALTTGAALVAAGKAETVDVPKWTVHEVVLTASGDYANPYTKASVSATFQAPDNKQKTVNGFWNGDRTFIVRFTPTAEGLWTYSTTSADPGLNGKTGAIRCVAPQTDCHGFVRRDANHPYHFVWDDGTRFFLFGQTYYTLLDRQEENWKASIDGTARRGMNKIRFKASPKEIGDTPDLAHWKKLDDIVRYMNGKSMLADFLIFNTGTFGKSVEQDERHLRYIIARYAAFPNVVWSLVNEWNYRPKPRDYWNHMGTIIHNEDPWIAEGDYLRPLSTHQQTRINFQFFDQSWPTHAIIQYGVRNKDKDQADERKNQGITKYRHGDQWGNAGILFNMGCKMPVVNDEYGYIGEPKDESAQPVQTLTREKHRHIIWGIYTAGGYGSAGDKYEYEDGQPYSAPTVWRDPVEYQDIQRLVEFFTTKGIEYWKMASDNGLVTEGERVYVLAEPGRQYIVYAAVGGRFSVRIAPSRYQVGRFDPRTGEEMILPEVTGGQLQTFALPDNNDWVIYLVSIERKTK